MSIIARARKLTLFGLLAAAVAGFPFFAGFGVSFLLYPQQPLAAPSSVQEEFHVFWEAWQIVGDNFYGRPVDAEKMTYGAIQGAVSTLQDPNTAFITPESMVILQEDMTGSFEGIGALVRMNEEGYLVIVEPLEGRPADLAGLKAGDIVLKVDDVEVKGMNLMEAIGLIRGPQGTEVRLLIRRQGIPEPFEVTIVRERIEMEMVEYRLLEGDVGYIKINEFTPPASRDLETALIDLLAQDPRGLILDLRDNPGGLVSEVMEVASEFIPEGVIFSERGKGEGKEHSALGDALAPDIPLVVLVNQGSASASEILAGAVQDHHRGVLIGETTFGKGSVQAQYGLSDGSGLHLTIAHWFTPSGREIDGKGLVPDIEVSENATLPTPPAQEGLTYVIKTGDTLWGLAEEYLDSGEDWPDIVSATNKKNLEDSSYNRILNPNFLSPGWKLLIPSDEVAEEESTSSLDPYLKLAMDYLEQWKE